MTRPAPWNDSENPACVTLYFAMLDKATAGESYVKAQMIRRAQQGWNTPTGRVAGPLADRSRASIEMKLMNCSAAHAAIGDGIAGRVTVTMNGFGYRAMPNYQAALKSAMNEAIVDRYELRRNFTTEVQA